MNHFSESSLPDQTVGDRDSAHQESPSNVSAATYCNWTPSVPATANSAAAITLPVHAKLLPGAPPPGPVRPK